MLRIWLTGLFAKIKSSISLKVPNGKYGTFESQFGTEAKYTHIANFMLAIHSDPKSPQDYTACFLDPIVTLDSDFEQLPRTSK